MAVFGEILYLYNDSAAIVFIGVLISLMLFEGCKQPGFHSNPLFQKLC